MPYKDADKMRQYTRQWHAEHPNYMREWCAKHPDYMAKRNKRNHQRHKAYYDAYNKKFSQIHPEIIHSRRMALSYPLDSQCELCGSTQNLKRHHPDYDYPDIFVTCCSSCHAHIHQGV